MNSNNSLSANSSGANLVPDPLNEFAHYPKSQEKMNNIKNYFDKYFVGNLIKTAVYFTALPAFISNYSASSIGISLLLMAVEAVSLLLSSYKECYQKKPELSKVGLAGMILSDIGFFLLKAPYFSSVIHYITVVSVIASFKAYRDIKQLEVLKTLKGYPLFSEMIDNPNYIPPNLPFNMMPKGVLKALNAPSANKSKIPVILKTASMDSLQLHGNISDNPEDISADNSPKIHYENDLPLNLSAADETIIPPAWCTPSESRLIGNANINSHYDMTEEMTVSHINDDVKNKKTINLSKQERR